MGVPTYKTRGVSNRGVSTLAGNSMHSSSVPCLHHMMTVSYEKSAQIQNRHSMYLRSEIVSNVPKVGAAILASIIGSTHV